MPQIRKNTAELALVGALDARPGRYADRKNEPKSNGPIGNPPDGFNPTKKKIWSEVIDLIPPGVLQKSDRLIVEVVVMLTYELRTNEINMAGITQLRQALATLGMTPADRSRVSATPEQQHDEWEQFG